MVPLPPPLEPLWAHVIALINRGWQKWLVSKARSKKWCSFSLALLPLGQAPLKPWAGCRESGYWKPPRVESAGNEAQGALGAPHPGCLSWSSGQFSSVAQSCLILFATPWTAACQASVHHQLPEPTQTHVHWVGAAIQPSHPLSSPSPSALNLSQHQGLFQWGGSLHQVAKVLEFQLQHQSFQKTPRTDLL